MAESFTRRADLCREILRRQYYGGSARFQRVSRIDLIIALSGVSWEEADGLKESGLFGDVSVSYIGKKQFIVNKRAAGCKKDLADLESLGEE